MNARIFITASLIAAHGLFGACGESVLTRIAALPQEGGTLRFEKGEYHFHEADARTMWLDPSNNKSGEKRVVFPLVGRKNLTIDGGGSTFVFHGRTFPFAATNCAGLTLRNFTVTTRYPSCAEFVVKEKTKEGFVVRFADGVCPYKVVGDDIVFSLDGHEISTKSGRLSLHSLDRLFIIYLMAPKSPGDKGLFPSTFVGVRAEDLGNREVRFTYYGDRHPKSVSLPYAVGEHVAVNLEEQRCRDVFFFEDCEGVSVENVAIRRFGGMGIVGQRSGNIKVENLSVHPSEGERVSLTADIVQFINCYGSVSMLGCEGGKSFDDWINIHGNYLKVMSADGRRVRVRPQHPSQQGFFPYRPGDAIEFVTSRERRVLASARVVSAARCADDPSACEVTVASDLPEARLAGSLVENVTLNPDVTIRNCRFSDFPHLRLSGRGRYLIEGNRFERCGNAVLGMDLADYWFESGRIMDMTIRNNVVVDGGGFSFGLSGWSGREPNIPKVHGRIRLEGNKFERVRGAPWSAVGVSDFKVADAASGARSEGAKSVRLGALRPRGGVDPKDDQWMIGCEVLDRDFAKFSAYRDYLPKLGIRSIRLQCGWAKCEKEKGKYDFAWLDECVDFAVAHGLNPVLETGYGNPVYKGGGGRDLAGGFPYGKEGLAAWDRWVDALSKHFKGRVRDWAMWNEPDIGRPADTDAVGGNHAPERIAAFNVRTAKTILRNIPDARIAGLSLATNDPAFNEACYKALGDDIKLFWRFIYHGYAPAPEESYPNVMKLKSICAKYAPHATLWQGENGAPSEMPGDGLALNHIAWSEISQAKWDMRRMLGDYVRGIPSSVFTICDYYHPGFGIGNYGLLRADSSRNVIGVKKAFSAVRNVATVFDSEIVRVDRRVAASESSLQLWEFRRRGSPLFVFWTTGEWRSAGGGWRMAYRRPGDGVEKRPAVFRWPGKPLVDPVWVDLLSGEVRSFPTENMVSCADGLVFTDVPVYDSPCIITERSAIDVDAVASR